MIDSLRELITCSKGDESGQCFLQLYFLDYPVQHSSIHCISCKLSSVAILLSNVVLKNNRLRSKLMMLKYVHEVLLASVPLMTFVVTETLGIDTLFEARRALKAYIVSGIPRTDSYVKRILALKAIVVTEISGTENFSTRLTLIGLEAVIVTDRVTRELKLFDVA